MGWRKTCAFWMNGLTKTQTGLILQKATHLDINRGNVWPPMLMKKKKFFLLPRTKNSYLTKERLSDYVIKRKGLWSKILSTSQYNTQLLRKKHNGFSTFEDSENMPPMYYLICRKYLRKYSQPHKKFNQKQIISFWGKKNTTMKQC